MLEGINQLQFRDFGLTKIKRLCGRHAFDDFVTRKNMGDKERNNQLKINYKKLSTSKRCVHLQMTTWK